jgi:hypothetical protein
MPFHELIEREDDGEDGEVGEYELRQRFIGVKAFFRLLKSRGAHPADMLKMLAAAGRACHEAPFHALSMEEAGLLFSETKAAHSWRCKILSREIELTGMRGSKLPGQKGREASASYREARQGNQNRKGRKKAPTARQGSFLRKLKTNQNHHETNHNHD